MAEKHPADEYYERAWGEYRSLRKRMLIVAPVFLVSFAATFLLAPWAHALSQMIGLVIGFPSFPIAAWTLLRLRFFPCPRCRKSFFGTGPLAVFRQTCAHCQFPKWSREGSPF